MKVFETVVVLITFILAFPAQAQEASTRKPPEPKFNEAGYFAERQSRERIAPMPAYSEHMPVVALRANLLYGAVGQAPNLGVELGFARKSSILVSGSYNGWNRDGLKNDNKKMTHWIAEAEYRFWSCEMFNGHFFGVHGFYARYNVSGLKLPLLLESGSEKYRYDGAAFGGGISYGYQLILGKSWNLEFNVGVGAGVATYDKAECFRCGDVFEKNAKKTFVAPTKLGISLVYIIK